MEEATKNNKLVGKALSTLFHYFENGGYISKLFL
jgi:hypothetical protein